MAESGSQGSQKRGNSRSGGYKGQSKRYEGRPDRRRNDGERHSKDGWEKNATKKPRGSRDRFESNKERSDKDFRPRKYAGSSQKDEQERPKFSRPKRSQFKDEGSNKNPRKPSGYRAKSGYSRDEVAERGRRDQGRTRGSSSTNRSDRRSSGARDFRKPNQIKDDDAQRTNPGLEKPADEPEPFAEFDDREVPYPMRAEMRGLPKELAYQLGGHYIAITQLLDSDPQLALKHAFAARRKASRLPTIRELAAEVAYQVGDYESALTDYRAVLRITGDQNYLPVIADCERAVGKPDNALRTLAKARTVKLDIAQQTEAILVEAGVRADLGQRPEAMRVLKTAISNQLGGNEEMARLRYAYADLLEQSGQSELAKKWFATAAKYDDNEELDAVARANGLSGFDDEFEVLSVSEEADDQPID